MTLNEVNILKNSVLDATEAYVDARLAVADFAKTQIGVTEGEPTKISKKWYHTVRCNAISGVANSGIVYHNVLAVGNTKFPAGSVVFLIAPNAQFTNQFILGKLDNTPINIVGGSIAIGGTDPETNPVFSVNSDGVVRIKRGEITLGGTENAPVFRVTDTGIVTIKNGGIYLNQTGNYYHLNLDSNGIKLGHYGSGDTYNFTVDASNGSVTIRNGQINLGAVTVSGNAGYDVNINKDGFNLGYLGKVDNVDTYNFSVTDKGKVTIKNGSINIANNFIVTDQGKVTINSGSINLGYITDTHLSTGKYNFSVDDNGNLSVGAYAYQNPTTSAWSWQYHFKLTKDGDLTLGSNFKLDKNGNLFSGGTTTSNAKFYVDNTGNMYVGGATASTAKFHVDNTGNMYLGGTSTSAPFYVTNAGTVRIKQGEITLGGTASSPNFHVDNEGKVTIKSGSITLIGNGTTTRPAFEVTTGGQVTIRRGSIRIGYRTTISGEGGGDRYDVNISSGGFRLGYLGETGSGTTADPYVPQYNFDVRENGTVTIKRGSINLGLNSSDNKYNFSVTNEGKLFARSGEIAGFTINTNSLTTGDGSSAGNTNARSELSSTTLRVSKWTNSNKRVSGLLDVNDDNGRLVINGDNATAPYIAVTSLRGWADNGNFPNPLTTTSGNYVRITPTSIALKENGTATANEYSLGTEVFKFLSQSQSVGTLGNLRMMVSNSQVSFTNVVTGKSGFVTLT